MTEGGSAGAPGGCLPVGLRLQTDGIAANPILFTYTSSAQGVCKAEREKRNRHFLYAFAGCMSLCRFFYRNALLLRGAFFRRDRLYGGSHAHRLCARRRFFCRHVCRRISFLLACRCRSFCPARRGIFSPAWFSVCW